jgi:hypothetical protein
MIGYCMRCKAKKEMKNVETKVSKRGVKMGTGNCPVCNTKMSVMLGK